MAQKTSVLMRDDLTGGNAAETVPFALDGTTYEIDLNKKNVAALRRAIGMYIEAGRPAPKSLVAGAPLGRQRPRPAASRITPPRPRPTSAPVLPSTASRHLLAVASPTPYATNTSQRRQADRSPTDARR